MSYNFSIGVRVFCEYCDMTLDSEVHCLHQCRAKSTDREPMVCFVTVILTLISSQSEGLGKMALGIVKYCYDRPSQPIGVIWFAVSCRGPHLCICWQNSAYCKNFDGPTAIG